MPMTTTEGSPLLTEEEESTIIHLRLVVEVRLDVKGREASNESLRQMGRLQALSAHADAVARFFEETTDAHVSIESVESMPYGMATELERLGLSKLNEAPVEDDRVDPFDPTCP